MTREERVKRIEELEQEFKSLEQSEIAKHNRYYNKKLKLNTLQDKEQIESLQIEMGTLSRELVNVIRRKIDIRKELLQLSNKHKLLQYAESKGK